MALVAGSSTRSPRSGASDSTADGHGAVTARPAFFSSPRFAAVAAELAPLADRFATAGHRLYLVGGTVRDLVAGEPTGCGEADAAPAARTRDQRQ